jgi:hypothetical protein
MDTLEKDTMNTRVGASLPFERQKKTGLYRLHLKKVSSVPVREHRTRLYPWNRTILSAFMSRSTGIWFVVGTTRVLFDLPSSEKRFVHGKEGREIGVLTIF